MSKPIYRAAIIGLGYIGGADQVSGDALGQFVQDLDGTHFEALSKQPRVDLVAGSSRDEGRRERFAARAGARTYADWQEMLAVEKPEIVSVATYAPQHAEITLACAAQGVRVIYCEKPIATRLVDAERMVQACQAAGALLVINHNRRFHPNFRRLRDLIGAGDLGEISSGFLQWTSGRLGGVGTHVIDAFCMLTGRKVAAVSGTLDLSARPDCRGPQFHDPGAWGVMQMDNGMKVFVNAPDYGTLPLQLVVNGSQGRATVMGNAVTLDYWDGRRDHWPNVGRDPSSMDQAVQEIITWLDGDAPFPYAAQAAVDTLAAILAFHASHDQQGAWVPLPLTEADREREVQSG
ncbi:MAG: Gfo/Idh/MocA family oxidoreductase [Caldilineaceae bacterium]|nr:Gfo/Idh/MocA family oxidoreductase [Caldilineaceae bacterium]